MNRIFITLLVVTAALVCTAAAEPLIPCEFYGTVSLTGQPAPPGTLITAVLNGEERGSIVTTDPGHFGDPTGPFGIRLTVQGNTSEKGSVISFFISGYPAAETAVFVQGAVSMQNLTGDRIISNFYADKTTGTAPLTVSFTDTSTGSPTAWNWSFGDGSTVNATSRHPVHTYSSPGNYTVSLNVTNAGGSDTKTALNYIMVKMPPPVANFSATPTTGTAPFTVIFTDTSTGSPTAWNWSFGDGSTVNATIRHPVHTYSTPGNYTVSLNVTNAGGSNTTVRTTCIQVDPQIGDYSIILRSGWNFISTPRKLMPGNDTASIFFQVDTAGHSVLSYNASEQRWHSMLADEKVRSLEGIWIYSNSTTRINLFFDTNPMQTPPTKTLSAGWNAIGYSDTTPVPARDALISVQNKWAILIGFNQIQQKYETSIIRSATDPLHGDQQNMYPGKGYWLYMTDPGELASIGA